MGEFYREGDGPKLVKRDAPLVPGDRLKGGQYISFCTSIISTGCEPKFFEVGGSDAHGYLRRAFPLCFVLS